MVFAAPGVGTAKKTKLVPPLGWRPILIRLLAAGAPGYGMLVFSAFIYRLTGNPFTWTMQNVAWPRMIVHVLNGMPRILMAERSAIPDTIPGSAMGRVPS